MFRPLAVVIVRPLLAATVVAGGAVALAPAAQAALGQGSAYALSGPLLKVRNGTNWDTGTNVRAGTNWDDGTNWDGGTNWDDGTHWDT